MNFNRRQFLKALGLSALAHPGRALADPTLPPKRVVFFVQPHGHVPSSWAMDLPGAVEGVVNERDLTHVTVDELPAILKPFAGLKHKMLAISGLAHTSVLHDIVEVHRLGGDANNHNVAVAGLLTASRAAQVSGSPCTGGAISLDQVLAQRLGGPGRFGSRVYGGDYVPNQVSAGFTFLGPAQPTPMVRAPLDAWRDLLGAQLPETVRQQQLQQARLSMLDSVASEYRTVASQLGARGRQRLEAHATLVRELEVSLAQTATLTCDTAFDPTGYHTRQFMRLIAMAFSCDLTRVATYSAPVPPCSDFNYPASSDVHASYAHASVPGMTSCGQTYTPVAEQAMTDLSTWYAGHLAYLLQWLDSIPEANGTLLDNTLVVWVTELGTPTHRHNDSLAVLFGGAQGYFKTGRFIRYPVLHDNPVVGSLSEWPRIGPAHSKLWVSVLQALGQSDDAFGIRETRSSSGERIIMTGALPELRG